MSLRAHRYRVKTQLLLLGYPCPGCWKPITQDDGEFHHALFREGAAFTDEQKAFLYDARNGTLVHHACHMDESLQFQLNCSILITQRSGGAKAIHGFVYQYNQLLESLPEIPRVWNTVLSGWNEKSKATCPACQERTLHSYITGLTWAASSYTGSRVICWNCLWRNE
jgi:hypothetical protein